MDRPVPARIAALVAGMPWEPNGVGMSGAELRMYPELVLKIEPQSPESDNEYRMMTWLRGRLPVPEAVCRERAGGMSYLLMTRLPGDMACAPAYMERPERLAGLLARAMELLWAVEPEGCPCVNNLERKLRLARDRVERGLADMSDAEPDTYGRDGFRDPRELLEWLEANRPPETLRLSHGDLCLPNLLIRNGEIGGFLDLGRSGLADPWQDIALCWRSLRHNADGSYGPRWPGFRDGLLFEALGREPDWEKLRYYILLDELF